jgi:hypothetical protein
MSIRTLSTGALATTGLAAVGVLTAATAIPVTVPTSAAPSVAGTDVVAGTLSPANFQRSLIEAYEAKKAADIVAVQDAVVAKWQAEAAAAEAAAQAAAVQASAVPAVSPSANGSAPAPVQSYSAPAASASAPAAGSASGGAAAWASSGAAMSVKNCESGNNYSTNTGNGYYGAWQFDLPSWHANGGGAYAATPDQAPAWAQDQVAYNYYQVAGWGPWACA